MHRRQAANPIRVATALLPALAFLLPAPAGAQSSLAALRKAARSAEAGYERTMRWLAPSTFERGGGSECEEVVGRFCLTFDTLRKPPSRPERREVGGSRQEAIRALCRYFEQAPGALDAAAPLVRLLVEDGRAAEAVEAAQRFALAADSATWREWLLGYALHAAGHDASADRHFERALALLPEREREDILSIDWLLDPQERARVQRLDAAARAAYVRHFWSVADPRLATAVNEARVQHIARHVEARMRARIPQVSGMLSWGRDLDQLTVRYGSPISRERVVGTLTTNDSYIEHFDTTALAFAPRALLRDGLRAPEPGERWPLAEPAPRSAHAIPSLPRIAALAHQLTRYPRGDSMLVRVDLAPTDTIAGALEAALFVLDRSGGAVAQRQATLADGARQLVLEVVVPRDTQVYGAELYHAGEKRLYRARYLLQPLPRAFIELSDLRVTEPLAPDSAAPPPRTLTDLRLSPAQALGLHAEVHGIAPGEPYEVSVGFVPARPPSAVSRGLRWLGARLGLVRERHPVRVRWLDHARASSAIAVSVVAPAAAGLYFLEVEVRSGTNASTARRLVRVLEGATPE